MLSGITSAITLNTTAAGVLPEFCHLPAATSNLTRTLITSATTLAGCHRKGGATLVHSWQSVTSFKLISLLNANFCHVPSTRTREWLPQIAHFNIFVLAHKNANEPAGFLPGSAGVAETRQNSGSCVMADVIGFCGKLLELSV